MQFSKLLIAVLGLGTAAFAAPTDADASVAAAPPAPAAPLDYCDKFDGRERRECRENNGYCNKFDGRERRECNEQRGGGYPGGYYGGEPTCNQYRSRRDLPERCLRDCDRARRDGFQIPQWCY